MQSDVQLQVWSLSFPVMVSLLLSQKKKKSEVKFNSILGKCVL